MQKTVLALVDTCCPEDVEQIIIFIATRATPQCLAAAKELEETVTKIPVKAIQQTKGGVGECRHLLGTVSFASHAILLGSDMEIPLDIPSKMLDMCKKHPNALVSLSRWKDGGSFTGYPKWQLPLHYIFQKLVQICYFSKSTDATAGYIAVPSEIFSRLRLKENSLSVFLEYKLILYRLGLSLVEIPVCYSSRREGKATNTFWGKLKYFKPFLRVRFTPKPHLLEGSAEDEE
ncbi:MAG: hypothetical protein FWG82_04775 [Oscillospiraceae bacterium]|nr:hypothetical protein [Oscillospiraceae bacterium]